DHVCIHVLARGASSRADFDAGPPARLSRAQSNVRHLALGEALETSRPYHAPALIGCCASRNAISKLQGFFLLVAVLRVRSGGECAQPKKPGGRKRTPA